MNSRGIGCGSGGSFFVVALIVFVLEKCSGIKLFFMILAPHSKFE
jgi:hypothetical protein